MMLLSAVRYSLFAFVTTLFFSAVVYGQQHPDIISIRHISFKEGLASKMINCGIQDSKGFIWLGTTHGLQRYDGKHFKIFSKEKDYLQDNNVCWLAEDDAQRIWIVYGFGGTGRYSNFKCDIIDLNNFTVKTFEALFGKYVPFTNRVSGISGNGKGEVLLSAGQENALWLYSAKKGFRRLSAHSYAAAIFDSSVSYCYGQHFITYHINTGKTSTVPSTEEFNYLVFAGIDNDGTPIYNAARSTPGKRTLTDLTFKISANGLQPYKFFPDSLLNRDENDRPFFNVDNRSHATFFYSVDGRVFTYEKNRQIELFDTKAKAESFKVINDVFSTADGQRWLCTENGLWAIDIKQNRFLHLLAPDVYQFPHSTGYQCRSIYADTTGVYIKSWEGLYHIQKKDKGFVTGQLFDNAHTNFADGFYCDGKQIIVSGNQMGILHYELATGKHWYTPPIGQPGSWCGVTTRQNKILVGWIDGIYELRTDGYRVLPHCDSSRGKCWVYKLFYNSQGKLWAVTNTGIYEVNNSSCLGAHYEANAADAKYRIPFTDLHDVHESAPGIYWLATNGGGLIKWDSHNGQTEKFTVEDGLCSNVLYCILKDDCGFFWISTENGLMRFDPESKFVKTYTTDDGLSGNEFNRVSYFKATDGTMYFGGMDGVNAINPKDFQTDTTLFNASLQVVSFNQFNAANGKLEDRLLALNKNREIVMNPGDRFFTMEFQLLNFKEGNTRYAYKIENFDKTWNYISENSIRISGLPAGKYTVRIKAQNVMGDWSNQQIVIPLTILTPFYRKWWFIVLCLVSIGILVWIFIAWKTYRLKRANKMLEQKVEKRTLQLRDALDKQQALVSEKDVLIKEIHHRVKNNLQVISSLLELQADTIENRESRDALNVGRNRIASIALIHQNLYQNKDLGHVAFEQFIKDLYHQIGGVFSDSLEPVLLETRVPSVVMDIDTVVPLGLIINELVTNSYKYAFHKQQQGRIRMELKKTSEGNFELHYSDNGVGLPIGFDAKKTGTLGMQLINDLARQLGGRFWYQHAQNEFIISFSDKTILKRVE